MLYIIRHGQTDMNARLVHRSRGGPPLSGPGTGQAKEAL